MKRRSFLGSLFAAPAVIAAAVEMKEPQAPAQEAVKDVLVPGTATRCSHVMLSSTTCGYCMAGVDLPETTTSACDIYIRRNVWDE